MSGRCTPVGAAALALLAALPGVGAGQARGQAPHPGEPVLIAHVEIAWSRPTVVADRWGRVHVFWGGARLDGPALPDGVDRKPEAIYHSVWDGRTWSEPRPVLRKPRGAWHMVRPAAAAVDDHLVLAWTGGTGLYVNRVAQRDAHEAAAWEPAQRLADGDTTDVALLAGPAAAISAIYTRAGPDDAPAGNVFLSRSDDGGSTWSAPVQVSALDARERVIAPEPSLARDRNGGLHAAWAVRRPPHWLGERVEYARSTDGGRTWSAAETLAAADAVEPWVDSPNLVATPDGMLHVLYACGKPPHRCYRASADGGATWSAVERPFGELVSLAGWDAFLGDADGGLHLFTQQRYPMGMYYAAKPAGAPWQTPLRVVDDPLLESGHFPRAVLSGGNRLHAVWQRSNGSGDVMYMDITTAARPRDVTPPPDGLAPIPTLTRRIDVAVPGGDRRWAVAVAALVACALGVVLLWRRRS